MVPLIASLTIAGIGAAVSYKKVSRQSAKDESGRPTPTNAGERRTATCQSGASASSYAIPVNAQMRSDEQQDQEEILRLLEKRMRSCEIFLPERVPDIIRTLKENSQLFGRTNSDSAFEGEELLTVPEKRALGLNTRMKYTKAFILNFDPDKPSVIEPKSFLENMHLAAANEVRSRRELAKLRAHGFVRKVEIEPCGDARDCERVRQARKVYPVGNVPALPLESCDAPYCRCINLPVID